MLLALVLLTGCWDRVEVEDQAYVISMGIDKGVRERLQVTVRVAEPSQQRRPPGTGLSARLLTAEGDTVLQAIYVMNGGMGRRLDLRHLRALVWGESLARDGLEPVIMELERNPFIRSTMLVAQARGRAMDVLQADAPTIETDPSKLAEDYLLQGKYSHLAPPVRFQHFLMRLAAPGGDPYLPVLAINPDVDIKPVGLDGSENAIGDPRGVTSHSALPGELPRNGGNPVELIGTAIFQGDKLQGFLTIDETQMLLALRGEMGKTYLSFADPDRPAEKVMIRLHQENRPNWKALYRQGQPQLVGRLLFEAELLAAPSGVDYVPPAARKRLEVAADEYVNRTMQQLLTRLKRWRADPAGLGLLFRGRFATWEE
ncbi:MAG: Ger(x)C family spore germination protein, partial [Mycobacterium leprae]